MFTVEDARNLCRNSKRDTIDKIIELIRECACEGNYFLDLYMPLTPYQKRELSDRGFEIIDASSLAIQRDSLYHKIYWTEKKT